MYIVSAFTSHLILKTKLWNKRTEFLQIEETNFQKKLVVGSGFNQICLFPNFGLLPMMLYYLHIGIVFLRPFRRLHYLLLDFPDLISCQTLTTGALSKNYVPVLD